MYRNRLYLLVVLGLLVVGAVSTSGCGQKGDLYQPDRAEQQPAQQQP